ncbi:DUF6037 family protein [Bifidobacterium tibiigranuli]|uniref:DUF6037 family protein n=1 Tax=Bifidobacterium tibiigranuli TaxID=2172043 RepID=UPI0026F0DDD1|nr:DUF6037 family protein [Bifidobacterium tibiigranuli]MCI1713387.1 DUF6037 family protein [Bifidobacterium tibiigranuli]
MMELAGLTRIVDTVMREEAIDAPRLAWDFTDGPQAFQATYVHQMDHKDEYGDYAQMLVAQILKDTGGERPWSHIFHVHQGRAGLWMKPWIGEDYATLKKILGIEAGRNGPRWSPVSFIQHIDDAAGAMRFPGRHLIRYAAALPERLRRDVDEADKTILLGFRHNTGNAHQTAENNDKTRRLISKQVADYCRETNQSSCWTDQLRNGQRELPIPRNVMELQNSHQYSLPA